LPLGPDKFQTKPPPLPAKLLAVSMSAYMAFIRNIVKNLARQNAIN